MFGETLREKAAAFDKRLEAYRFQTEPALLGEAMNYSLFAGGKRIRPVLLLESYSLCGGTDSATAFPLAAGIEMIHTYSLIHDDLPAMDDDALRRGMPTSHVKYGEAMAILAGDGLLNAAFETMLAGWPKGNTAKGYRQAIVTIAAASGASGMVAGQAADMTLMGEGDARETVEFIHTRKTGAMIRAACVAGALAGGAAENLIESMSAYGHSLGFMFQIADDILDLIRTPEEAGKATHKDEEADKITYPLSYGLDGSYAKIDTLYEACLSSLEAFGSRASFHSGLAGYVRNIFV